MQILIRTDASTKIGSGHVMRCLTLADMLKEKGAKIYFVCREMEGHLCELIETKGYQCFRTFNVKQTFDQKQDAMETLHLIEINGLKVDLIIADHYQIDEQWEQVVRKAAPKVMVIDDLANRRHDCDLLLDQNYFNKFETRYDGLVPAKCRKLLGLKYLLLRPEFYEDNITEENTNESVADVLVFYGGSDSTNETLKVLDALNLVDVTSLTFHVVVGSSNSNREIIELRCRERNYHFYVQINYLAQLMRTVDLALGAGGVTMWERCFLGIPSIVTVVADNQRESTEAAADAGAIWNLGWHECVEKEDLVDIINRAIEDPNGLKEMTKKAKQLMQSDIKYKTHPVVEAIMEILGHGDGFYVPKN
ncbi:UDP-2,4-diacetamido-2,4,6-trideoxy-beta-L-altropyranose hydrolase [Schinkia azotoformans]|uniref:UDP-2,4-diacetamido-2,4, 6-trideoxy-beta-L-altropyranose hydrolase n=1 Tax=Schinkia azotoformans TaxID=1454 RepID=UPI002E23526F|nr:UDP-2,4-diacetamido-2,4,6-trideoxy-beta-L-altropyranose hydrolase [Schinkia azotoformans]MED4350942.1 UDP-2,4-diacetamido-2,4,6-trideoxy-beta-L-altropyranose hydrolase [Schinkia azotoformans]